MSKDKPEVGDVFCEKHYPHLKRIMVHKIEYKNAITYVIFNGRQTYETSLSKIKKELTYLGKSKAKIGDLFEVQDDRD